MGEQVEIRLCHQCSCGVANDDWTHLDGYLDQESADEMYTSILASLECMGYLTMLGEQEAGGYWDCELCSGTMIGENSKIHLTSKWTF